MGVLASAIRLARQPGGAWGTHPAQQNLALDA